MSDAPTPTPVPPLGAMCGRHPQTVAVLTCNRCGDFACHACASQGLCAACAQRNTDHGLHMHRDNWTIEGVFAHAWKTLTAQPWSTMGVFWGMFMPFAMLCGLLALVAVVSIPGMDLKALQAQDMYAWRWRVGLAAASEAIMLLASPVLLGIIGYCAGRVEGRQVGFEALPAQLGRVAQYALLTLMTAPVFLVLSFLQLTPDAPTVPTTNPLANAGSAPVMIVNLLLSLLSWPLVLTQYLAVIEIVLDHEVDAIEALKRAAIHLMHRPVAAMFTAFLLWILAVVAASCCMFPAIFFGPYVLLAFVTMYCCMRTPAP